MGPGFCGAGRGAFVCGAVFGAAGGAGMVMPAWDIVAKNKKASQHKLKGFFK
jgi:hypothetical protein